MKQKKKKTTPIIQEGGWGRRLGKMKTQSKIPKSG